MAQKNWKEKAAEKLAQIIDDIATLEVVTLSGNITMKDINLEEDPGDKSKSIKFKSIMDHLSGSPANSSKVSVVAATKIQLDKDIQQFVMEKMKPEHKELFLLHNQSINQALEARKSTFQMLVGIVD